jgi:hypothetical protein
MGRVTQWDPVQEVLQAPGRQEPQDGPGQATSRPVEEMSVLKILGDLEWAGDGQ